MRKKQKYTNSELEEIAKFYQKKKQKSINDAIENGERYETGNEIGYEHKGKKIAMQISSGVMNEKSGLYCGDLPPWDESLQSEGNHLTL